MFRKTLSKIGLAVMGIAVALTACHLEITQEKNAEMPVFSIEGAVDYNDTVTIKTETEGADIFYTTDGSAPTAESTKYTGPVAITADCTIKAVAVKSGMQNSVTAEKSFTVKKYTVTFDANGHGTAPGAISGKHKGEVIALPAALSATGFNFGGWSDGTNTYAAGANYTVSGDVTLKAVWTQMPTYTVTFDANGHGTAPDAISGKYQGDTITLPAALSATGFTFGGWSDGTNTYEAGATYTVTGNVTIRAIWTSMETYTVTFDSNGHGTAPDAISGKYQGDTITLPAALSATGFTFGGWSDGTNTYAAGATYTVTGNVTLRAVWTDWNTASAPVFSVADSQIDYNDTVTITTATDGAAIYYTTDGSTPTSSGTQYIAPIAITSETTIKAIAVKSGMNNSAVTEKAYTVITYTVTFDANGHGAAPSPMTGYKTQQITLPQAITASGWSFNNWSDGTNTYAAGSTYTVTGNITLSAVWTDTTPPANVTNLTATCTASGTVKLTWTNPTDDDFAKVVITYDTSGSVEVLKTATPNNEKIITGLTDGNEYTFTVKAYDDAENVSSGVSVNTTPVSFGGLQGTPTGGQTQGDVIKESWMDQTSGNIKINGTAIAKTSEVVAIPAGTVAAVTMPNDTSWSTYYSGSVSDYKGVYLSERKVKLDPFVMSQYQVTQKLYMEVMGLTAEQNPSWFKNNPNNGETQENRPVECVSWYKACAFCNELTKKTFGETTDQCVYYSNEDCTAPYTKENANSEDTVYAAYDTSTKKWTKKGYRLPTEAEWEFCARGGDPNAVDGNNKSIWSYAYAGVQTSKQPTGFSSGRTDTPLNDYAWYTANGNGKTHEVGKKSPNTLGLYDMSGNVFEWCYDGFSDSATSNDAAYTTDGNVVNPLGSSSGSDRVMRGGCYSNTADACAVSSRCCGGPWSNSSYYIGFRLVRSISN